MQYGIECIGAVFQRADLLECIWFSTKGDPYVLPLIKGETIYY